jgi:dipeptidase D
LASVKTKENAFLITTSQRSSVESAKEDICAMVKATFSLAGAKISQGDGYPGWTPNPNSEIVKITAAAYKNLFKEEPEVLAVHAGLECGLIGDKYPNMDMISFGPDIRGAHSPDEKLHIASTQRFWELTLEVLKNIPDKK